MIVSTKKRSSRYNKPKFHAAYGIQNWLCAKGYCLSGNVKYVVDKEQYKELLKAFCLHDNPQFDFSKVKKLETYESYVNNRFQKFCVFATKRFKK